jgi:hypothetical protein
MGRKSLKRGGTLRELSGKSEEGIKSDSVGFHEKGDPIKFSQLDDEGGEEPKPLDPETLEDLRKKSAEMEENIRRKKEEIATLNTSNDKTPIQRHLPEEVRSRAIKLRMDKIQKNMKLDQEYEDLHNELRRMHTEFVPIKDGKSAKQQIIDISRRMVEIEELRQKNSEETRAENKRREETIQSLRTKIISLGENYSHAAPEDQEAIRDKIENIKRSIDVLKIQGGKSKKRKTRKGRRSNRRRSNRRKSNRRR